MKDLTMYKVAYISDLHIEFIKNNRIKADLKETSISQIADLLIEEFNKLDCDFGVIAGDISHCLEDTFKFLKHVENSILSQFMFALVTMIIGIGPLVFFL